MQTRQDHVQAYQFFTGRLSAAVVGGTVAGGENPMRRTGFGSLCGIVAAVLLCAGFGVYGLISPGGSTSWQQPNAIIVEKETGNRYLLLDGVLRPTLNLSSALLYHADGSGVVVSVSRNSLAGLRHGPAVGIPGAPDWVPADADLLPGSWALCADPARPGTEVTLDPADAAPALGAGRRVLVTAPGGALHLVWRDTAYAIGSRSALLALGLGNRTPVAVSDAWLAALATGPELAAPSVPHAGGAGPQVDGAPTRIGQLLATGTGDGTQYFVVRSDGIAPVSPTARALLAGQPGAAPVRTVPTPALAALPVSPDRSTVDGLPDVLDVPDLPGGTARLCVRQTSEGTAVSAGTVTAGQAPGAKPAVAVRVPTGRAMVAYSLPVAPQGTPDLYLISDQGRKFPLPGDARTALGLHAAPVGLPAAVLAAIPDGPALVTGTAVLTTSNTEGQ